MEPQEKLTDPNQTTPPVQQPIINNLKPKHPKRKTLIISISLLIILICAIGGYFVLQNNKPITKKTNNMNSQITEEPNPKIEILATMPPENPHILYNTLLDPYSHMAVYSIDKDTYTASESATIVIDGKSGKSYDEINGITVSPNGKRIAFIATKDKKMFVIVDGIEGKKYDYIKNLTFSADSQHIAYAAGKEKYFQPDSPYSGNDMVKKMGIVVDAKEEKVYDGTYIGVNVYDTYFPVFSKDGKKVTYTAIKNKKDILIVDDNEIAEFPYQQYPYPQFIGNTYDLIYLDSENNKQFLVVTGKKGTPHDNIWSGTNLPYYIGKDASQIAYEAEDNDVNTVIINGTSFREEPLTRGLQAVTFSPSGKYIAYYLGTSMNDMNKKSSFISWVRKDLFVNGKFYGAAQSDRSKIVNTPLFSPNEKYLVYTEYNQQNGPATIHILSVNPLKKITDFSLPKFKAVGLMKFSDDSKYLYFKGWQDRNIVYVTLNLEQLIKESSLKNQ